MAMKQYAPPVSVTSDGRMATVASGFDFQWVFLLVFYSNYSPKCTVFELGLGTDRLTDGRTDGRIAASLIAPSIRRA